MRDPFQEEGFWNSSFLNKEPKRLLILSIGSPKLAQSFLGTPNLGQGETLLCLFHIGCSEIWQSF